MQRRIVRQWVLLLISLLAIAALPVGTRAAVLQRRVSTYQNPLPIQTASGVSVESCADPSIIQGQTPGDNAWYMYCTTDPLNGNDRDGAGNLIFHLIPILRSSDLVHWSYVGDVFSARPGWVHPTAGLLHCGLDKV